MDLLGKSINANKHLKEEYDLFYLSLYPALLPDKSYISHFASFLPLRFVSNLTGSSMIEIVALSLIVPVSFLFRLDSLLWNFQLFIYL